MRRRLVVLSICLLFAIPAAAEKGNQQSSSVQFGIGISGGFWGVSQFKIQHIPLEFRQVPVHPDRNPADFPFNNDDPPSEIRTVNDDTVNLFPIGWDIAVTPQVLFRNKYLLRAGPQWSPPLYPLHPVAVPGTASASERNTREQNQMGTILRGTGTSLTYYAVEQRINYIPGALAQLEARKGAVFSFIAGMSMTSCRLVVERGYDRYNSLETLDRSSLATLYFYFPHAGIRLTNTDEGGRNWKGGLALLAGPVFIQGRAASTAPNFQFSTTRGFMVKIEVLFDYFHQH